MYLILFFMYRWGTHPTASIMLGMAVTSYEVTEAWILDPFQNKTGKAGKNGMNQWVTLSMAFTLKSLWYSYKIMALTRVSLTGFRGLS